MSRITPKTLIYIIKQIENLLNAKLLALHDNQSLYDANALLTEV